MIRLRLHLLGRVVLALALVGLVPLGLAAVRLLSLNRDALRDQVLRSNAIAAGSAAARVADLLAVRRSLAGAVAAQLDAAADPAAVLASVLDAAPDLVAIVVLDAAGQEAVRVQRRGLGEEVTRAVAGRGDALPRLLRVADGREWLCLTAPLAGARGEVVLLADGSPVTAALAPVGLGEEARLSLVAADGEVVAGAPLAPGELPASLLAGVAQGRVVGAGLFPAPGGDLLAAYDGVAGTPWLVLSRQPAEVAEAAALRLVRGGGFAVGVAVALVAALSAAAYASLVRPLRRLGILQRRLAGTPEGRPVEGDELADLAASAARLERHLRDREALEEVFLGRYQVLDLLGQGAMGIVFRGWDPRLHRPVALKTMRLDPAADPAQRHEMAARLLHEAVAAARFNHPHIVAVYDVLEGGGVVCLAMEYVEGTTLERASARGPLPVAEVARIGAAMVRALAAAHAREVIHQDVKPANVLLGADGTVKVTDFGISRVLNQLAVTGETVFGTPGYMPPEALAGGPAGAPGDLFALGACLYTAATGVRPFAGRTLHEILTRTFEARPLPPGEVNPAVPPELDELILALLAAAPERRPVAGEDLADRLDAIGQAAAAAPAAVPAQPRRETDHDAPTSLFVPTTDLSGVRHLAAVRAERSR